jgi:YbbR domain-containing protein
MAWHPLRNLGLKLLALVLACLLWMTVTRDHLVERTLRVPLEYQNIPEGLEIVGDPPAAVDLRVRGPSGALGRLQPGEVVAVVDLRGARPGQRLFHLLTDEVQVPFGIEVAQVNPPTVPVTFERSGSRSVPVVPAIEGEPAVGYVSGEVTIDPARVEVVGPVSRLAQLREATTEPVLITNATQVVRDTVTVGVTDPALRLRQPRSASVTVQIRPAPIERAVHDVPVHIRNMERGRRATVVPPRVSVVLRGSRDALGSLDVSTLDAWVDLERLQPGRYALPVKVETGRDFGLVRVEPNTVDVRVR